MKEIDLVVFNEDGEVFFMDIDNADGRTSSNYLPICFEPLYKNEVHGDVITFKIYDLNDTIWFGKHKGIAIETLLILYNSYFNWMLKTIKYIGFEPEIWSYKKDSKFIDDSYEKNVTHNYQLDLFKK